MAPNPYRKLPDVAYWKRAVAGVDRTAVDPVGRFDLRIDRSTRIATAGSCFAQHIARHLGAAGFSYLVTEPGHPVVPQKLRRKHGYGVFSARYGNVYTARQLRQLAERALGLFAPVEPAWRDPDGSFRDPFRPAIQPGNFISTDELCRDRAQHLAAVRQMLETLDVFVFTLGLTEFWECRADGAALPVCPGVTGGTFDADRYAFVNQDVMSVLSDMEAFLTLLHGVNPQARVVLTVSPVPLAATAQPGAHVLTATSYSKSVLRVAADMLAATHDHVHYFPSYEVITGAHARGAYFADDLRQVTEDGVAHVMRLFLQHAAGLSSPPPMPGGTAPEADRTTALARAFIAVECEETALDPDGGR